MNNKPTKTCCLCGKKFTGYGSNADPVADGTCCDDCNRDKVIPARIKAWKESDELFKEVAKEFA
jgi:hypothetical protein